MNARSSDTGDWSRSWAPSWGPDDTTAELKVEYKVVNQVQFSFRDSCEVPVTGSFTCELRGFEGQLLFVNGELPNVHVDGKDVSFW